MVELARKRMSLNSLWSVFYCVLVLALHAYVTYVAISKYRKHDSDTRWMLDTTPSELRTYVSLVVLSLLFLPLFVFVSVLKVGNSANDGVKLGRDHALDTNINTIGSKIKCGFLRKLWQQFPPFSPVLHLCAAFLVILPEVILTAEEVQHGLRPTDAVWTSDLDFLFSSDRAHTSDVIGQSNLTVLDNASYVIIPTPQPPRGGWIKESSVTVAFVHFAVGLLAFAARYASVFWFTNKIFGILFAFQLLFMAVESLFAFSGVSVLYKLAVNYGLYEHKISLFIGGPVVIVLYMLGGLVLLMSTMAIYEYGSNYFQSKFEIIDKRHHPEAYTKQTIIVHGSCHGYKTHTMAMVCLVILGMLKGPIIYEQMSVYRVTKDSLLLTCVVIDIIYMISWIILWTIFTLKQQWQFRILDYVPLTKPVFMISNDHISKVPSFLPSGSLEMHYLNKCRRKRPSSLPSDLTTSESGFGEGSEDERFEISLPPLAEVPGLERSRRRGSTHSEPGRRSRRNMSQRVTFHETVKPCLSTDDEGSLTHLCPPRGSRPRNVRTTADVHPGGCAKARPISPANNVYRRKQLSDTDLRKTRGSRTSLGMQIQEAALNNSCNTSNSDDEGSALSEPSAIQNNSTQGVRSAPPISYRDCRNSSNYIGSHETKSKLKSTNLQTRLNNDLASKQNNMKSGGRISPLHTSILHSNGTSVGRVDSVHPRPLEFVSKKPEIALSRRDSANYSLTSSQDTASNDSDQNRQALCSQNANAEPRQSE